MVVELTFSNCIKPEVESYMLTVYGNKYISCLGIQHVWLKLGGKRLF